MADESPIVVGKAYFHPDLNERRRLFAFLDLSFNGGVHYKFGEDAFGNRILIEHESELVGTEGESMEQIITQAATGVGNSNVTQENRYYRRLRTASYKNLCRPIIEKYVAYLTRNEPERSEAHTDDFKRLDINHHMSEMLKHGLKSGECFIGFDAVDTRLRDELGEVIDAKPTTQQVKEMDPDNEGKPYFVIIDPSRVVDFEMEGEDEWGVLTRIVIEETVTLKGSLMAESQTLTFFREWTADGWVLYQMMKEEKGKFSPATEEMIVVGGVNVMVVDSGPNPWGVVPYFRFMPKFPTQDLADMNRLLFNVESLWDEELYSATFTQKVITGSTIDDVMTSQKKGTGNTLVLENPEAGVDVIGAIEGQATSLAERCRDITQSIYELVSMEHSDKNVAEAAEKKKRDLEALYTTLLEITRQVERAENWLLAGMGVIDADDDEQRSTYDKKFDVTSVQELLDELRELTTMPFIPPRFKRDRALSLMMKLDPYGDHKQIAKEVEAVMDITPDTIAGVDMVLNALGVATVEAVLAMLGLEETPELRTKIEEKLNAATGAQEPTGFMEDEEQIDDEQVPSGFDNPFEDEDEEEDDDDRDTEPDEEDGPQ